jgi:hypothetical protein
VIWFRRNRAPRRRFGPAATAVILRRRPVGGVLLLMGRSAKAQLVSRQDHAKTEKLERDPTRLDHRLNQMVLTHQTNRVGLRAFVPHLLYEADLGRDCQMLEGIVANTVAVEVHFTAIGGFDKSIPLAGQFRYMAMVFRFIAA